MNDKNLIINTCSSPNDPIVGAHVGIQIRHVPSKIVVKSVKMKTQHENRLEAMEKLKFELVKERFCSIDENDLVDGERFSENWIAAKATSHSGLLKLPNYIYN
tara:strand:+ start:5863 stop:6171 length:309 start_codon:yes stop_codon:yes gene_type:complete